MLQVSRHRVPVPAG